MDYARYNVPCTFYIETQSMHLELNLPKGDKTLLEVFKTLVRVQYKRVQEYGLNGSMEREKQSCTVRVLWHPKLKGCTHIELKTLYETVKYKIEIQQMPFDDGEVEMLAVLCE